MPRGKHRVIKRRLTVGILAVAGCSATLVLATAAPASADSGVDWNRVAACESSGNWAVHTGMYEGGLQFLPSTWVAYGGTQYAPHAYQATQGQQITVANKVLAAQGPQAWPVCFTRGAGRTPITVPSSLPHEPSVPLARHPNVAPMDVPPGVTPIVMRHHRFHCRRVHLSG